MVLLVKARQIGVVAGTGYAHTVTATAAKVHDLGAHPGDEVDDSATKPFTSRDW